MPGARPDPTREYSAAIMQSDNDVTRDDTDDYDLLTFGEAGARLTDEIKQHQALLADPGVTGDARVTLERRLDMLIDARERNRKPTLQSMKDSGFFRRPTR